jgi:hypothetical protein
VWQTLVYLHRDAPDEAQRTLLAELEGVHRGAVRFLPLTTTPAIVYLHASTEGLQAHSCAGRDALAYYDGAIHLAPEPRRRPNFIGIELWKSLKHEYVHHVLVSDGIGRPIWLQEALAMSFAGERPARTWREHPIALEQMIATPEFESAYYGQAYYRLELLRLLCNAREGCQDVDLVHALQKGQATPESLFEWAISHRAREGTSVAPLLIWYDYVAHETRSPLLLAAKRGPTSTP